MNDINSLYKLWCENAVNDKDLIPELKSVEGNQDEILDRFYKNLEFGTAGLRLSYRSRYKQNECLYR